MADRWEVERALRASALPPQARLIAFVLLTRSDAGTAAVPAQFSPSLITLALETGLARSTVASHLNVLETGGWVTRGRSARAVTAHVPTTYRLHTPASPGAGLVREPDKPSSPGAGLELVREPVRASPGAGHNQNSGPKPDQKKMPATADPYSLPGFAEFWDTYPLKRAKRQAAAAYRTALTRAGDPVVLIKAAAAYRDDPGRSAAYTKHPATWLNGDCWNDEPEQPRSRTDRNVAKIQSLKAELRTNGVAP